MPSSQSLPFNSRTLSTIIKQDNGELLEELEWSKNKAFFRKCPIAIDSKGTLSAVSPTTEVLLKSLHSCSFQVVDNGTLNIKSFDGSEVLFLKANDRSSFVKLFASLLFWQGLKPRGISYKILSKPFDDYTIIDPKQKKSQQLQQQLQQSGDLLVASCKIYGFIPKAKHLGLVDGPNVTLYSDPNAGWFTAMVTLKSNGLLQLINENDGQLLYTIDIKLLTRSEIRELHHSIFESSNYLFVGIIEELRKESMFPNWHTPTTTPQLSAEQSKVKRIILEFPYRIDVEDWLVALTSFTIRQYSGLDKSNSLRISRKITLGILEATLTTNLNDPHLRSYAEVQIWGTPWFRTAVVESPQNPFFRESFELDLPLTTTSIDIILKKAGSFNYRTTDEVIGHTTLHYKDWNQSPLYQDRIPLISNDSTIGQIYATVKNQRNYILPPDNFNNLEQMILNLDVKQLVKFVLSKSRPSELENTSVILLDIFQSLQRESDWFSDLIDEEVRAITTTSNNNKSTDLYNTLFRGNTLLSKSLELYNLRIGQEFLEKVIGEFITTVVSNKESCELDPLRIRELTPDNKEAILDENFQNLLRSVEDVWKRIYTSSNDLPEPIKQQLTILRKKIELYTIDDKVALNSVSAFIFLRFFCPVILNPKLFFLTKDHQTGDIKRTLTLISKILMTFANKSSFGAKEPYLVRFNKEFIEKHKDELDDYLDKITMKKMDFTPKHLKLSTSLERTDIILTSRELLKELPTVPFLIDKYLRIDQFVDIVANEELNPSMVDDFGYNEVEVDLSNGFDSGEHKIGSLEFEKLVLERKGSFDFEFGSEKFIQTLLNTKESEKVFSYINSDSSLKDLIIEANKISSKKLRLITKLSAAETRDDIYDLKFYSDEILSTTTIDNHKNVLKIKHSAASLKTIKSDSLLNSVKLKFQPPSPSSSDFQSFVDNGSAPSIKSISPKKRITNMIRSASYTVGQFSPASNNNQNYPPLPSNSKDTISDFENKVETPAKKKGFSWFGRK